MVEILRYTQNLSSEICDERFVSYANPLHASAMRPIGAVIRELRKAKGMTLEDLAAEAGTDSGNLSRLERGQQGYTEERLKAIATALGVTVAELWILAALEPDERAMLEKYRHLGSKDKGHAQAVVDALASKGHEKGLDKDDPPPAKSA